MNFNTMRIWDHWRGEDYVDGFNAGLEAASDKWTDANESSGEVVYEGQDSSGNAVRARASFWAPVLYVEHTSGGIARLEPIDSDLKWGCCGQRMNDGHTSGCMYAVANKH